MKKLLLSVFLCVLALTSFGQATILFNNRAPAFGLDAPIYDLYIGGSKLEGTNFWAQLFVATTNSPTEFFSVGDPVNFRTGLAVGYVDVGVESSRSIPNVAFGDFVYTQVRAWTDNPLTVGYTNIVGMAYETGDLNIRFGSSETLFMQTSVSQLLPPPYMIGLQSFAIVGVPEPAPHLLAIVGGLGLVWLLRRDMKNRKNSVR